MNGPTVWFYTGSWAHLLCVQDGEVEAKKGEVEAKKEQSSAGASSPNRETEGTTLAELRLTYPVGNAGRTLPTRSRTRCARRRRLHRGRQLRE